MSNIKQQQIIEAAFALFYQKGFHAVGINEIIKQSQVAKKTLYNHFKNKDALILATLEWHHQQIIEHLQKSITLAVPGKDSILVIFEQLDAWLNGKVTQLPTFNGCYFTQAHKEFSMLNPEITASCLRHKQTFQNIFKKQVEDFEKNAQKSRLIVDLLTLLKEGVIANEQIFQQKFSAQQATFYIENMLRFKR